MRPRRSPPALGCKRRPLASTAALTLTLATISVQLAGAALLQPHNYLLDDSALTSRHELAASLSPHLNDASGGPERQADGDVVSIIGAGLKLARALEQKQTQELERELELEKRHEQRDGRAEQGAGAQPVGEPRPSARGNIMELDTSSAQGHAAGAQPSKADLKATGPAGQWFEPGEAVPLLKISAMATPSKHKKVYFRSEKKLVDGAFHSPTAEKRPAGLVRAALGQAAAAGLQRRSSGASGSSAPPGVLQDGLVDFLKKFRDVYVQTRPAGSPAAAAGPLSFATSVMSAAASSPLASFLAPSGPSAAASNSRPNLMGALSTASQVVSGTAMLSQAAASNSGGATNPNKSPASAQSYVSFWSKTFPTWVRKVLKQMRRRSLHNSSKRHQQHQQHHAAGLGQKAAAAAVASVADPIGGSSSSSSSAAAAAA